MKKWVKKSLVICLSIITLGMVSPADFEWHLEASANKQGKKSEEAKPLQSHQQIGYTEVVYNEYEEREQVLTAFYGKAEELSHAKFGEKIKPYIEEEFTAVILPKIEEAIEAYTDTYMTEELRNLEISSKPAFGVSEKIFHIYNKETGKDVIRFHVRRENPPKQGHWFNFHYHTDQDRFVTHHHLGSIYWSRDTPPHWGKGVEYH